MDPSKENQTNTSRAVKRQWLGRHPGRTLHRIGVTIAAIWVAGSMINIMWPKPDQVKLNSSHIQAQFKRSRLPSRKITIFIIGTGKNSFKPQNELKFEDKVQSVQSIIVVKFSTKNGVKILQAPIELGIMFPGERSPKTLSSGYEIGGVALITDIITEVLGLEKEIPKRYVVINSDAIRRIIDSLGGIEISLQEAMRINHKTETKFQTYFAGKHFLDGAKVEEIFLYLENSHDGVGRRKRVAILLEGLFKELRAHNKIKKSSMLVKKLLEEVETDMNKEELSSLVSAFSSYNHTPIIRQIELAPRAGKQILRQLKNSPINSL